jgi:hypothetical protein
MNVNLFATVLVVVLAGIFWPQLTDLMKTGGFEEVSLILSKCDLAPPNRSKLNERIFDTLSV